ncbi:uncharacterized protein BKA55DRAFT_567466 [Fusarium redolens]|uniref:Uncharacterized protein n=1 Tax=Fusarium redolens TaxID=48865 RepID=A0A9P9H242_FUSRE|nr:uncharacterized protein BKA55DRAFT_567466 [Fusarium redolens]KAH7249646.1 hypothetical protein BKA55DRAFT_567466 [Fusarium redolens]
MEMLKMFMLLYFYILFTRMYTRFSRLLSLLIDAVLYRCFVGKSTSYTLIIYLGLLSCWVKYGNVSLYHMEARTIKNTSSRRSRHKRAYATVFNNLF